MTFKYSVCSPNLKEIKYFNNPISGKEVLETAKNHNWIEELNLSETLGEKAHFNPSLDFTCIEKNRSFCLTANFSSKKELEFSLWYNRPKKVKVFFGLFGETEKIVVDDTWGFSLENALEYLQHFVDGNYLFIQKLYK